MPPATDPTPPVLRLEQVACRRGDRLLFEGLTDTLGPGELLWLRGSNGRGKTSLLRLVAGLALPEQGRILWEGRPVRGHAGFARELVYIGHANALKDDLTAAEALAFLARVHGREAAEEPVRQALARVGLSARARAPVRTLSQGQRRRVALARLALGPPARVWVLDEPFDSLDLAATATLHELLDAHRAQGGSILLTSHHLPLSASADGRGLPPPRTLELDAFAVGERLPRPPAANAREPSALGKTAR